MFQESSTVDLAISLLSYSQSRGYFPRFSFSTVSMVFYTHIIHIKILPCFCQVFHMFILKCAADEKPDIRREIADFHLGMLSLLGYSAPAAQESLLSSPVYVEGLCTLVC